jgi:hypothetical protein
MGWQVGSPIQGKSFYDTVAYDCRYGTEAVNIWGDWEVLWEDSEADYQGHASFLARNPVNGHYVFYEWWYGSCSGCDTWEAQELTDYQIEQEMRDEAIEFVSFNQVITWVRNLQQTDSGRGNKIAQALNI